MIIVETKDINSIVFFFFQAEDGIRDLTVTGVQTCALPISVLAELFLISTSTALTGLDKGPSRLPPSPPCPTSEAACSCCGRNSRSSNQGGPPRAIQGRAPLMPPMPPVPVPGQPSTMNGAPSPGDRKSVV